MKIQYRFIFITYFLPWFIILHHNSMVNFSDFYRWVYFGKYPMCSLELACEILYELTTVGGANITTDGAS